jgi:sugar lactone lactonase YvrE
MLLNRVATAFALTLASLTLPSLAEEGQPRAIRGFKNPESAVVGPDGRVYISEIGGFDKDGDGRVLVVDKAGKAHSFAEGLDDPKGLSAWQNWLLVADKIQVLRIDRHGQHEVFAGAEDFPSTPQFLNDLDVDRQGNVYVSDSGDMQGSGGAIYSLNQNGKVTEIKLKEPSLGSPNGLLIDGPDHMLVVDLASGNLYRLDLGSGEANKLSGDYGSGDGLARDSRGRVYVSDYNGRVFVRESPRASPRQIADNFESAADIAMAPDGRYLLVPDMKAGELVYLPLTH